MNVKFNKEPLFENDSYLFTIEDFKLNEKTYDPYTEFKLKKFKDFDISKDGFEPFLIDRGSLRMFDSIDRLVGSIYTFSVGERNNMTYQQCLQMVREIFNKNPDSRRAVLRMANSILDYRNAEIEGMDVSCLNLIHYLNGRVNLVFRSSDIKNELFTDIITIYKFFIYPIYGDKPINLQIFGSTGQNVNSFGDLFKKITEVTT